MIPVIFTIAVMLTILPLAAVMASYPLVAVLAIFFGITVVIPILMNFTRFSGKQVLACPEMKEDATVWLNPIMASLSAAYGKPRVKVTGCSLWGKRGDCVGKCLEGKEF